MNARLSVVACLAAASCAREPRVVPVLLLDVLVHGADGAPAVGARVRVHRDQEYVQQGIEAVTDAEGKARFPKMVPGAFFVSADLVGTAKGTIDDGDDHEPYMRTVQDWQRVQAPVTLKDGSPAHVALAFPALTHELSGVVLDGAGQPVAGAVVFGENPILSRVAHSDEQGRFTFAPVMKGQMIMKVWKKGYDSVDKWKLRLASAGAQNVFVLKARSK